MPSCGIGVSPITARGIPTAEGLGAHPPELFARRESSYMRVWLARELSVLAVPALAWAFLRQGRLRTEHSLSNTQAAN